MSTTRYTSAVAKRAVVKSVNYADGTLQTRWLEDGKDGPTVPIPHPLANKGGSGIFVGIKVGTIIVLIPSAYRTYIPIAVLPTRAYYNDDISSVPEADYDDLGFPYLDQEDIVIRGSTGSEIALTNRLDEVILNNEFGEGFVIGGGIDDFRCAISLSSPVVYNIAPSGIRVSGVVRRDTKIEDSEESFVDFLTDIESEQSLETIGWNPNNQVSYINSSIGSSSHGKEGGSLRRNPAFVENREIIYEFGRDWVVGRPDEELGRLRGSCVPLLDPTDRAERRSNVLGLSSANPNELIETVSGTVVDIFGNLLDINRRKIELSSDKNDSEAMFENIMEQVRHTIAYHMEINVKKGFAFDNTGNNKSSLFRDISQSIASTSNNARDRSRWSLDIDKEGLTKINIPASSETGNIPMLTRYENSSVLKIDENGNFSTEVREDQKKVYRNKQNRDIFAEQVGPGGIKISNNAPDNRLRGKKSSWVEDQNYKVKQEVMGQNIEAGTAFHKITQTAWALIKENINKSASDILVNGRTATKEGLKAISDKINNTVPTTNTSVERSKSGLLKNHPNAGGRSVCASLDGSMEMSIGANTIDRVSCVLDIAGAIIWRLGRDRAGRSAIIQADGTIALEVGGFDYIGSSADDEVDTRFVGNGTGKREDVLTLDPTQFRSGKIIIKVRRATEDKSGPEENDTLLVIDETGVTVTTAGRLDFISEQNMTFTSKSLITLDAPKVQIYKQNPKYFARTARIVK